MPSLNPLIGHIRTSPQLFSSSVIDGAKTKYIGNQYSPSSAVQKTPFGALTIVHSLSISYTLNFIARLLSSPLRHRTPYARRLCRGCRIAHSPRAECRSSPWWELRCCRSIRKVFLSIVKGSHPCGVLVASSLLLVLTPTILWGLNL